jgi:Spy/CpxP family protein refolding chaperone
LHLKQTTTKHIKNMKTKTTIALLAAIGAIALTASAQDNTPPAGSPPSDTQPPAHHMGGPGGQRGGFHLLPPPLVQQLKLTDDQKKQVAALEAETKAKLEKILTADQLTQLKNFRPPMRGGMGGPQRDGMGRGGNGPEGGDNNQPPPGPPPGEGDNNPPPAGDK